MGHLLTNEEVGNYSAASNFATLAGVVTGPVATMALPHIAASEDREDALRRIARAGALAGASVGAYPGTSSRRPADGAKMREVRRRGLRRPRARIAAD